MKLTGTNYQSAPDGQPPSSYGIVCCFFQAISFLTPLAVICVVKIILRTDKTEIKEAFLGRVSTVPLSGVGAERNEITRFQKIPVAAS